VAPSPLDLGGPGLVLNIGGQGEVVYAIDVNSLMSPTMEPARFIRPGRFILGDATALPVRDAVADEVIGNRFPTGDGAFRSDVAAEASRVVRAGGRFRIWSISGGGRIWLPALSGAGFTAVTLEGGIAKGVKR
jgi:ubiquinone/menaquinone biosynthesis C-methylase UbiE